MIEFTFHLENLIKSCNLEYLCAYLHFANNDSFFM